MNKKEVADAQKVWSTPEVVLQHIGDISRVYKLKHGMCATIPIICKGANCPYFDVCTIDAKYRMIGTRCPMEIAAIMARYEMWCEHFLIDTSSDEINVKDLADASLVRDLVDNEVQTLRAENKVAMSGDFLEKTLAQVDNKGKAYYEMTVGPASEYKMSLQEKRYKILQLLDATRKDKASRMTNSESYGAKAMDLLEKVKNALPEGTSLDKIDFDGLEESIAKKDVE